MFNWLDNERSPLLSYLIGTENKWRRGGLNLNLLVGCVYRGAFFPRFSGKQRACYLRETVEYVPRVSLSRLARIWWNLEPLDGVQMLLEEQVV